jgi:hypothetical protein
MVEFRPLAIEQIAKRGSIREADVRRVEHLVYRNGTIGRAEAEMLFALQDVARVQDPAWTAFFVNAVSDHIVDHAEPTGYVSGDNADWLMRWITCEGGVGTRAELELLVTVLERARWAPVSLVIFALDQIRHAVVNAAGPLRSGATYVPAAKVTAEDAALTGRILSAFGRDTGLPITRPEMDMLFDIDACIEGEPDPAWSDMLARATIHALLAGSGLSVCTRSEALAGGHAFVREISREERALARLERQRLEIVTNETLGECNALWLAGRMGNFVDLSPRELAMFALMTDLCAELEGVLRAQGVDFVDDVAAA